MKILKLCVVKTLNEIVELHDLKQNDNGKQIQLFKLTDQVILF